MTFGFVRVHISQIGRLFEPGPLPDGLIAGPVGIPSQSGNTRVIDVRVVMRD